MSRIRNKDLKKIYNKIYKKGEKRHFSSLIFSGDKVPPAKLEVLREITWKDKTVLDAGCGTGELAYLIAREGAKKVLGIDYSKEAIALAKKTHRYHGLSFENADLKKVRGKFDIVVSLGTLEHLDKPFEALKKLAGLLTPRGSLIVTCPNWINPRGYILMTLWFLFRAKITLADIHYLTPVEFEEWASRLKLTLSWRTVEQEWGHGEKMIRDFERRLPNVARDSKLPTDRKKIAEFILWFSKHVVPLEKNNDFSGAVGLYHFRKI